MYILEVQFEGHSRSYKYTFNEKKWADYFDKVWNKVGHTVKRLDKK